MKKYCKPEIYNDEIEFESIMEPSSLGKLEPGDQNVDGSGWLNDFWQKF